MDRWACVNLPALPLQILLKEHPDWVRLPAAVVSRDAPNGRILWLNDRAAGAGILPGLRYAAALGLERTLRAEVVSPSVVADHVKALTDLLGDFTPDVEPAEERPGVFWLNATGMTGLHGYYTRWAQRIVARIREQGYRATVVVGFTRFGTYAVSTFRRGVTVFHERESETETVNQINLEHLQLPDSLRETLSALGVTTIGEFLELPADGLRVRFGDEAYTLHTWASGEVWDPLRPVSKEPPLYDRVEFERPETDSTRLLATIARLLPPLLRILSARGDLVQEIGWTAILETRERKKEHLRPAVPTLDREQILDLVRLRLETIELSAGIEELVLMVQGIPARSGQAALFKVETKRDFAAGNRALARLRAEFGEDAVVRAVLEDRHLPEARFRFVPFEEMRTPRPFEVSTPPLVRRVYSRPESLQLPGKISMIGPYVISGGWWNQVPETDSGVHREYYFARSEHGRLLWIYRDNARQGWFLHGTVE